MSIASLGSSSKTRPFRRRDDGVSTVVSAVLVFSLIVVVLSIYMSTIVPDQVADAEAGHMRQVAASLGDIAAEAAGSITLHREGMFAAQLDLGTTTLPGISLFHSSGSLAVRGNGFFANFLCPRAALLARDGEAAQGGTYAALGGAPIDFARLAAVNLKISFAGDDTAIVAVDAGGSRVGSLQVDVVSGDVRVKTRDGVSTVIYDQILQSGLSGGEDYVINVLFPGFGFATLLGDSQGPFTLTTSSTAGTVQGYAVYWTEDGTIGLLGQGRDLSSGFQRTVNPAALVYQSANRQFLDQIYSLEGGAIVLGQPQGQYLTLAPFALTRAGGQQLLQLTLMNLTGAGYVTGSHRATVTVGVNGPTSSTVACTNPVLLLQSAYPFAWHAAWMDALVSAGLPESQATLAGSTLTVRLSGAWNVIVEEAGVSIRLT